MPPNRIGIIGDQTPQQAHDHPQAKGLAGRGEQFDLPAEVLQVLDALRSELFGRLVKRQQMYLMPTRQTLQDVIGPP